MVIQAPLSHAQILVISTLALSNTLCGNSPFTVSRDRSGGYSVILAYVPAPLRFERYPGLMTTTLSTTYTVSQQRTVKFCSSGGLTFANGGNALGTTSTSGRATISPSFR